jgi:beta-barrel assembly-enhancing protease
VKPLARILSIPVLIVALAGCQSLMGRLFDVATDPNVASAAQTASKEITPKEEYYIGRAVAANILSTRKVFDQKRATDYINLLGRTLSLYSQKPDTYGGYHFLIMDSDEINAFAAPGGLILVSRGLLRCADNEDALAAILSHEISHVVLEHGLNAIKNSRSTAAGIAALNAAVPEIHQLSGAFNDMVNDLLKTLVTSGYSRESELQADQMALEIMRSAGYDPHAFDAMLKLMETRLKPGGADFAKTHPDPAIRSAEVEKTLADQPPVTTRPPVQAARRARYQAALGNM